MFVVEPFLEVGSVLQCCLNCDNYVCSDFYENIGEHCFEFSSPPKLGDICCAQFSEDNFWYRAEVTAIEGIHIIIQ